MFKIYVTVSLVDSNGVSKMNVCEQSVIPSENMGKLGVKELGDIVYGLTISAAKTIFECAEIAAKKSA